MKWVVPALAFCTLGTILLVFMNSDAEDASAQVALNGLFAVLGALVSSLTRRGE